MQLTQKSVQALEQRCRSQSKETSVFAFVYLSVVVAPFSEMELEKLESHAAVRNRERGITGYLCSFDEAFIQYLEGTECDVLELVHLISKDRRHKIVNSIVLERVQGRKFLDWSMKRIRNTDLVESQLEHDLKGMLCNASQDCLKDSGLIRILKNKLDRISAKRIGWETE